MRQRHLKKGRIADRAHQYRVMADRLDFHLRSDHYGDTEVRDAVSTAKESLLKAADLLGNQRDRERMQHAS
jgi:hypothetical protein